MGNTMRVHRTARIALFFTGVLMLGVVGGLVAASSADAQQPCDPYTTTCQPIVKPTVIKTDRGKPGDPDFPKPTPTISGSSISIDERGPLPFTGADLTLFAATGFAAVGTGTILVRATRRRRVRD